jgi:hypothetical protein
MTALARLVSIGCVLLASGAALPARSSVQQPHEATAVAPRPPTFTVSGRVVEADGQPARDVVVTIGHGRDENGFLDESCEIGADGVFRSAGLEPGLYVVNAFLPSADSAVSRGGYSVVAIRDRDIADVTVTLHPSTTVSGRVTFESERSMDAPQPTVHVLAMLAVEGMRVNHATTASVADDGTFTLPGVYGPRLIRVGYGGDRNSPPWWPKAVFVDGANVTNVPIDFSTRSSARVEVVFSDRPTAVVGLVHDEAGLPVDGARVLLFSKDPAMWAAWSTAVQTGVSDENGRFWFVAPMPAGDYRAIALREIPTPSIAEAVDELARLEKFATPIVVSESKIARIELIVSRAR